MQRILSILSSKPHNPHYLNRYMKYLEICGRKNISTNVYVEKHHICPKAKDLFPEFEDLKANEWNSINLTCEQHIFAHIILWKLYGGSQTYAIDWIFKNNSETNSSLKNRKIPRKLERIYAAKVRKEAKDLLDASNSVFWAGRNRYATQDGVYFGSYLKGDPIIKQYDLIPYRTEKQIAQNASRTALASAARLGKNFYTNGMEEIFAFEPPDKSWKLGRKPRSKEWERKRKESYLKACVGAKTYTNGLVNTFIQEGEPIPEGFYPGMKSRPNSIYYYTDENQTVLLECKGYHLPPEGMIKIKTRKANSIKHKLNKLKGPHYAS